MNFNTTEQKDQMLHIKNSVILSSRNNNIHEEHNNSFCEPNFFIVVIFQNQTK